jgi:hypothetical protein
MTTFDVRTVRVEDLRDIEEIKQLRASYTRYGTRDNGQRWPTSSPRTSNSFAM